MSIDSGNEVIINRDCVHKLLFIKNSLYIALGY